MADVLFESDALAPLYDTFEGGRVDLVPYLAMLSEFEARSVLDVGCGTGSFATLASSVGIRVVAVDPARASIEVARSKPGAWGVRWHVGTVISAPPDRVDAAVMTGNVAQVFLRDDEWLETLAAVRDRLVPGGRLVFETRRPEAKVWERWAGPFEASSTFAGVGVVRQSRQLLDVALPYVTFRWSHVFPDGRCIDSDSTLRFRSDAENRCLLAQAGLDVAELREAPDRPGQELVHVAVSSG